MLALAPSQLDLVRLANSASQRKIGLFVELGVHFECSLATIICYLLHRVDYRFHIVLLAPDCGSESTSLAVQGCDRLLILP
jgi:hypothetical protein